MNDMENRLRTQLFEIGEGIEPSSVMPPGTEGRVARRRAVTVGALGAGVVVLALMATTVVGSLGRETLERPQESVATPALPTEKDFEGQVVASGLYEDSTRWFLFAYKSQGGVDPEGWFCLGDGTKEGDGPRRARGYSCGPFRPGRIGLLVTSGTGEPTVAYGQLGAQVDRLVAVHRDGSEENVRLWDAPEGFAFDAKFYGLFPLPDSVETLKAFSDGKVIAEREIEHPVSP